MLENLKKYHIILASKSPRRRQLLEDLGVTFTVKNLDVDEIYPKDLPIEKIPEYLAELKAQPFEKDLNENELIITSDTIVCIGNEVLGKPTSFEEAFNMLQMLSGKTHQVATGVCILTSKKRSSFVSITNVQFKVLTNEEIEHYINHYKPFDKAGAYGIQEWIGYVAVEKIEGSYFNVMGLPIQQLYEELKKY